MTRRGVTYFHQLYMLHQTRDIPAPHQRIRSAHDR
jgi:hypothetical protein